jgi:hypothetical protein
MIQNSTASQDGWYWANYTAAPQPPVAAYEIGNPPIFDRSAITSTDFYGNSPNPTEPNPLWYPTGYVYESSTKIPDIVFPYNFDNAGNLLRAKYEQTTHLEWTNSDFAPGRSNPQSCQDCHMPTQFKGTPLPFQIANIDSSAFAPTTHRLPNAAITLTTRDTYSRHALHGLNVFLNEMFQQFPLLLGARQIDYMTGTATVPSLITGRNSMLEQ